VKRPPSHDRPINEKGVILIVDDDPAVLTLTEALLDDEYRVLTAESGRAALELLQSERVDVLGVDYLMPEMNGLEVIKRAARISPHTMPVLITGHRDYLSLDPEGRAQAYTLLLKPYAPTDLIDCIRRACQLARIRSDFGSRAQSQREQR
jgi:DNA-binding NtrC family response regulator